MEDTSSSFDPSQFLWALAAQRNPKMAPIANMWLQKSRQDAKAGHDKELITGMSEVDSLANSGDLDGAATKLSGMSGLFSGEQASLYQKMQEGLGKKRQQAQFSQQFGKINDVMKLPPAERQSALNQVAQGLYANSPDVSGTVGAMNLATPSMKTQYDPQSGMGAAINERTGDVQTLQGQAQASPESFKPYNDALLKGYGIDAGAAARFETLSRTDPAIKQLWDPIKQKIVGEQGQLKRDESIKTINAEEAAKWPYKEREMGEQFRLSQATLGQDVRDELKGMGVDPINATAPQISEAKAQKHTRGLEAIIAGKQVAPPPETALKEVEASTGLSQAYNTIAEILSKPEGKALVGALKGDYSQLKNKYMGGDPVAARLWAAIATTQNQAIHDMSGAAVTPAEAGRILEGIVTGKESIESGLAKLNQSRKRLSDKMDLYETAYANTTIGGPAFKLIRERSSRSYNPAEVENLAPSTQSTPTVTLKSGKKVTVE